MGPEDIDTFGLLRYIDPQKIDFGKYDSQKVGFFLRQGYIFLNEKDSREEQIKSVLHEIIHMHPQFISYTGGLWQRTIPRNKDYEDRIEDLAQRTYNERPDLVRFISDKLEMAREINQQREIARTT